MGLTRACLRGRLQIPRRRLNTRCALPKRALSQSHRRQATFIHWAKETRKLKFPSLRNPLSSSLFPMRWFKTEVLTAVATWAATSAGASLPVPRDALQGTCPGSISDLTKLVKKLSNATNIYFPGSDEFTTATTRWSVLQAPKVNFVVVPGTENDVVETVSIAMCGSDYLVCLWRMVADDMLS